MNDSHTIGVRWRLVGIFYAIAFGGSALVAAAIWALGVTLGDAATVVAAAMTALLYMPMPLVAGLITERIAGGRYLIGEEWRALKGRFWRGVGRSALVTAGLTVAILLVALLVGWLAGLVAIPGAGRLVHDDAELHARLLELAPALAGVELPSIPVLAAAGVVQGLMAGLTINALFAFGEEYGWRGVLSDLLAPLGRVRATLLVGVLWGSGTRRSSCSATTTAAPGWAASSSWCCGRRHWRSCSTGPGGGPGRCWRRRWRTAPTTG